MCAGSLASPCGLRRTWQRIAARLRQGALLLHQGLCGLLEHLLEDQAYPVLVERKDSTTVSGSWALGMVTPMVAALAACHHS